VTDQDPPPPKRSLPVEELTVRLGLLGPAEVPSCA
jgi:hypothetical protein